MVSPPPHLPLESSYGVPPPPHLPLESSFGVPPPHLPLESSYGVPPLTFLLSLAVVSPPTFLLSLAMVSPPPPPHTHTHTSMSSVENPRCSARPLQSLLLMGLSRSSLLASFVHVQCLTSRHGNCLPSSRRFMMSLLPAPSMSVSMLLLTDAILQCCAVIGWWSAILPTLHCDWLVGCNSPNAALRLAGGVQFSQRCAAIGWWGAILPKLRCDWLVGYNSPNAALRLAGGVQFSQRCDAIGWWGVGD